MNIFDNEMDKRREKDGLKSCMSRVMDEEWRSVRELYIVVVWRGVDEG